MWLLRDPLKFDVKYQASAQPFLITGMLVTALAIGHRFFSCLKCKRLNSNRFFLIIPILIFLEYLFIFLV